MTVDARATDHCERLAAPLADVTLYRIDLTATGAHRKTLAVVLSPDEHGRAAAFRLPADRARFIAVRAVLRLILADAGLGPPDCLTLVTGRYGKPELAHPSPLRFNVAHSGDVGLVAVGHGRDVGVDVEAMRPRADLAAVARRFFTPAEATALERMGDDERTAGFYRCWVRKEACAKAIGLGLRLPFDGFEVGIGPSSSTPWRVGIANAGASTTRELVDVEVAPDYAAAVAASLVPAA
jgi:4'-phosphopantetheinyl transferase